jgi:hypothetical protein
MAGMAFIGLTAGSSERDGGERLSLNGAYIEAVQMAALLKSQPSLSTEDAFAQIRSRRPG